MSRSTWGIVLRLAGPVIQCLGLVALLAPGADSRLLAGIPLHRWGVVAFLGGLGLVGLGLILSIMAARGQAASRKSSWRAE